MRQESPEFAKHGAEIVTVSPDDGSTTADLAARLKLPLVMLSDPDLAAADAYGVRHVNEPKGRLIPRPAEFVVDGDGTVRFAYVGQDPTDRPPIADVLAAVAAAGDVKQAE